MEKLENLLEHNLLEQFKFERQYNIRNGIYKITQCEMAYNSNKMEGSSFTEDQTILLFETGTIKGDNIEYRAKDVEEMTGHFLMFNKMLDTYKEDLSADLIKQYHYCLKAGVFEDIANGYAIGDWKTRKNVAGTEFNTCEPKYVDDEMDNLLTWYSNQNVDLKILADFHYRYEKIHPFQDGNGRTGRIILFKECLKNGIYPFIILNSNRNEYIFALNEKSKEDCISKLVTLFQKEQSSYLNFSKSYISDNLEYKIHNKIEKYVNKNNQKPKKRDEPGR